MNSPTPEKSDANSPDARSPESKLLSLIKKGGAQDPNHKTTPGFFSNAWTRAHASSRDALSSISESSPLVLANRCSMLIFFLSFSYMILGMKSISGKFSDLKRDRQVPPANLTEKSWNQSEWIRNIGSDSYENVKRELVSKNLFLPLALREKKAPRQIAAAPAPVRKVPVQPAPDSLKTRMENFRFLGIINTGAANKAIFKDLQTNKSYYLRSGETLPNEVKVQKIRNKRVLLFWKNETLEISF